MCDFKERPVQDVVNYIVKRLHELLEDDERGFRDYFEMLETLSDYRQLQPYIDEAKEMLTQIDVKNFASYNWGLEAGREEGMEKGALKEKKRLAIQLLPMMDDHAIVKVTGLSEEEVASLRSQFSE